MANHIVDTDTTAFGKGKLLSGITETGGCMAMVQSKFMNQSIDFPGLDPRLDVRSNKIQNPRIELAGQSHLLALVFV